jgi:hypothetical protein
MSKEGEIYCAIVTALGAAGTAGEFPAKKL